MPLTAQHIIEFNNIDLGYPPEHILLEKIHASGFRGELIALMGRNGSGKSTLLRSIAGLSNPLHGDIIVKGKPLETIKRQALARLLTYVGTAVHVPENLTVYEMVSLGRHPFTNWWGKLKSDDVNAVNESLKFVDMQDFTQKKMLTLSDGERQRVLIAMALSQDVEMILLDEPTAFLDIPNRMNMIRVLHEMSQKGKTIIYSTHDFDTALQFADKIWLLHDRKLIQGSPEDLGMLGHYNNVFKDAGISFDSKAMQFRNVHKEGKEIILNSENQNVENIWTAKMLQRIGFHVVSDMHVGKFIPRIEITIENDNYIWKLTADGKTVSFDSLYKLASYLTHD
ncbi:MAG TPA: ABC transporter ATP-binding protein [Bacteroidales bacterium]|nr:ABC transporter ATP-binding protein [Bacteroidales bacterium]